MLRETPRALLTAIPYVLFAAYLALIGLEATAAARRNAKPGASWARVESAQPAAGRSSGFAMQSGD